MAGNRASEEYPMDRASYFTFHDSTFECLADAMKLEVTDEGLRTVVERLAQPTP